MCGRFTLRTPAVEIASLFEVDLPEFEVVPRYNIAPSQLISVVVKESAASEDDPPEEPNGDSGQPARKWRQFRWGLIPSWAKDTSIGYKMINARGETVAEKPSFRTAFQKRRCLVLADGFYEWQRVDGEKQPHYFTMKDQSVMAFAGLWETWNKGESPIQSSTIITTSANELLGQFHDRMPAILPPENFDLWLDPDFQESEALEVLIQPFPAGEMTSRPVSKLVNHVKNETPECLAEI